MSLTSTHPLILILCTVIGSGAVTSLVSWLLRRIDQRRNLEQAIAESATIRRLELEIYRQSLFLPTTSRMQHEQQLEDDYRHRLDADDWNYQRQPHN